MNSQEQWVEEMEDVARVAVDYFDNFVCTGSCNQMEECLSTILAKVSPAMQDMFSRAFTADEIKEVVFQMGPTKAPGPDGMNALFYHKIWHIVGNDVVNTVLDFLNNEVMLPDLNHTNIVLIPKVKNEKMSEYKVII